MAASDVSASHQSRGGGRNRFCRKTNVNAAACHKCPVQWTTPLSPEPVLQSTDSDVPDTLPTTLTLLNPTVMQLLSAYRRLLEANLGKRLLQLTLFGSYARGEARADSDIDVAVVLGSIDRPSDRTLPMELAGELVAQYGLVITPLVLSVSELELLRQREDLLAENLDREGIAI